MITIAGIGTGTEETLSLAALTRIKNATRIILQTENIPVASYIKKEASAPCLSLDSLYEEAEDFDSLAIAASNLVVAEDHTLFLVMGSVLENNLAKAVLNRTEAEVIPGISFGDYALQLSGYEAKNANIFCAFDINEAQLSAQNTVIVTEIDNPYLAGDIALALMRFFPHDYPVLLICGSEKTQIPLEDLPKQNNFSYATSLAVSPLPLTKREGYTLSDFLEVIDILLGPNGCPWDKEQTFHSLRQYVIEEAFEVAEAVDKEDDFLLYDELGDLLLQIVFYAKIGEQHKQFDFYDITTAVSKKMIERHTHIFGNDKIATAEGVVENWDKIKREQRGQANLSDAMEDVIESSTLLRAAKIQKYAAKVGLDFDGYLTALEKIKEEAAELAEDLKNGLDGEKEAGDLLFSVVNLLRLIGVNPEKALYSASNKFISRFKEIEKKAASLNRGISSFSALELDELWESIKKSENR